MKRKDITPEGIMKKIKAGKANGSVVDFKGLSLADIEREVSEAFYGKDNPNKARRAPSVTHYEWEEDGKRYSSWRIDTGSSIANCGDGGMDLFLKALKEQGYGIPEGNTPHGNNK